MSNDSQPYEVKSEKEKNHDTEEKKRVQLAPIPTKFGCPMPSSLPSSQQTDESGGTVPGCRPLAILLRLRVTQIVAGIVFVLLGTVACLEETTRYTLSWAIPAGVLSIVTAIANIQANRREFGMGLLGMPAAHTSTLIWNARTLKARLLILLCVSGCMLLLALDFLAVITATNQNKAALGCLQALTAATVLGTEAIILVLRWHWATKPESR